MSVIMKTTGHNKTPAERDKEPWCPNKFQFNGLRPTVGSKAKIFTPINSATIALHTKKAPKIIKRLAGLFFKIGAICFIGFDVDSFI